MTTSNICLLTGPAFHLHGHGWGEEPINITAPLWGGYSHLCSAPQLFPVTNPHQWSTLVPWTFSPSRIANSRSARRAPVGEAFPASHLPWWRDLQIARMTEYLRIPLDARGRGDARADATHYGDDAPALWKARSLLAPRAGSRVRSKVRSAVCTQRSPHRVPVPLRYGDDLQGDASHHGNDPSDAATRDDGR